MCIKQGTSGLLQQLRRNMADSLKRVKIWAVGSWVAPQSPRPEDGSWSCVMAMLDCRQQRGLIRMVRSCKFVPFPSVVCYKNLRSCCLDDYNQPIHSPVLCVKTTFVMLSWWLQTTHFVRIAKFKIKTVQVNLAYCIWYVDNWLAQPARIDLQHGL